MPLCDCPVPRCANSFVYDRLQHVFYMFGGNPGSDVQTKSNSSMRLDDLWKLRVSITAIIRIINKNLCILLCVSWQVKVKKTC